MLVCRVICAQFLRLYFWALFFSAPTTGKLSAHNQTNPIEWHPKFIRSIIHAPSCSSKAARRRWRASQARAARVLVLRHFFEHHRRRSEHGNYKSNIQLAALPLYSKGRFKRTYRAVSGNFNFRLELMVRELCKKTLWWRRFWTYGQVPPFWFLATRGLNGERERALVTFLTIFFLVI